LDLHRGQSGANGLPRPYVHFEALDRVDPDGSSVPANGRRNRLFSKKCNIDGLLIPQHVALDRQLLNSVSDWILQFEEHLDAATPFQVPSDGGGR